MGVIAWLDARATAGELRAARAQVEAARGELSDLDVAGAEAGLRLAGEAVKRARSRARRFSLLLAGRVPVLGRSARAVSDIAEAASLSVSSGLAGVEAARFFPVKDGRLVYRLASGGLALDPWLKARAGLERASRLALRARAAAERISRTWVVGDASAARRELVRGTADLDRLLARAAHAARALPAILGRDEPRRYLLAMQTLAEARATGGLIGGVALLEANGGRIRLGDIVDNEALADAPRPLPMPAWFGKRYDRFGVRTNWQNANMEADFPTTGGHLARLYERTIGGRIDGVIGVDAIGLARLLEATGPIDGPEGLSLDAAAFPELALRGIYEPRYFDERKDLFARFAERIWSALVAGVDVRSAGDALARATAERHLMIWMRRPAEQSFVRRLDAHGSFRSRTPFLGLVTQASSANKVGIHQSRAYQIDVVVNREGTARFRMALRLSNDAPKTGLPDYVAGVNSPVGDPPAFLRTYTSIYLPRDALPGRMTLDGKPISYESEAAPDALILSHFVPLPPKSAALLRFEWEQPDVLRGEGRTRDFAFDVLRQPTANPDDVTVRITGPEGLRPEALHESVRAGDTTVSYARTDKPLEIRMRFHRPLWGRIWDFLSRPLF